MIYYRKETGKLRISKSAKAYAKENNMSLSGIAMVTTTKSDKKLLKESLNKKFLVGRSKFL